MSYCRRSYGWTLLELLVVLVIIGILAGTVIWKMSAWESSSQRIQLESLSDAWIRLRELVMERSMHVSCQVSPKGWQCWEWASSLSGELGWQVLQGLPWQSQQQWPASWRWSDDTSDKRNLVITSQGELEPAAWVICHDTTECWSVWDRKMVNS